MLTTDGQVSFGSDGAVSENYFILPKNCSCFTQTLKGKPEDSNLIFCRIFIPTSTFFGIKGFDTRTSQTEKFTTSVKSISDKKIKNNVKLT